MGNSAIDSRDRNQQVAGMSEQEFDVVVIGGGITGAGVARDAALRGLKVALVEARDFASGTSSRSSKMVHGGLRYLAQGDVALVREAASERAYLNAIAPHLAQPLPYIIPTKNMAASATMRTALWSFEKLGNVAKVDGHQVWSKQQFKDQEPAIESSNYRGAVVYTEYLTDDARLTLANIRSAKAAGAQVLNYFKVSEILIDNGQAYGVKIKDNLPGIEQPQSFELRAKLIVNAAGPWVDAIRQLEQVDAPQQLQLTKGIHVVVPRARFDLQNALFMTAADGRTVFAVPRGEVCYLGTTDTFHSQPDYWPEITSDDVDYVLATANAYNAGATLTVDDVTAVWSGVRPLIAQPGKSPSEISRKDEVWQGSCGILSVAGGKLTAYRRMAERVVDRLQNLLDLPVSSCITHKTSIPGGALELAQLAQDPSLQDLNAIEKDRLLRLYGDEALAIVADGGDFAAEARFAVLHEGALTLEDYWVRRSARAWLQISAGLDSLVVAARAMGELLGWDEQQRQQQIEHCQQLHQRSMAWRSSEAVV